jgi:hypothetical protein
MATWRMNEDIFILRKEKSMIEKVKISKNLQCKL